MAESAISHIKQQNVPLWGTERIVESATTILPLLGRGRQRLKSDPSTNANLGVVERAG
jgi:hypothetical protein